MSATPLIATGEACRLEVATAVAGTDTLILSYLFRNGSLNPVFVFNRLYKGLDDDRRYKVDPNLIYVQLDGTQIILSKKVIPVPEDVDVEKPEVPLVTYLPPQGTVQEKLTLKLPLRLRAPYTSTKPKPVLPKLDQLKFYFEIGFFASKSQKTQEQAAKVATTAGEALRIDPFPAAHQRVLRVGPLPAVAVAVE